MQARCFCPEHGRLGFEDIIIKNGTPTCAKCSKPLEYGKVLPRPVVAVAAKPKSHGVKKNPAKKRAAGKRR
jgi:hypothetical protein